LKGGSAFAIGGKEVDSYYERLGKIHDEAENALQQAYKV